MDILYNMLNIGAIVIISAVPATIKEEIGSRSVLLKYTLQIMTLLSNVVKIDTAIIKIGKMINAISSPSLLEPDRL